MWSDAELHAPSNIAQHCVQPGFSLLDARPLFPVSIFLVTGRVSLRSQLFLNLLQLIRRCIAMGRLPFYGLDIAEMVMVRSKASDLCV